MSDTLKRIGAILKSPTFRWKLARVRYSVGSIKDLVTKIPDKRDTMLSGSMKVYSMLAELEGRYHVLFDERPWYQLEAEARGFSSHTFPMDVILNNPSIEKITPHARHGRDALIEVTTKDGHQVFIPVGGFDNDKKKWEEFIYQYNLTVFAHNEEAFDMFLDSIWESYQNQIFVDSDNAKRIWTSSSDQLNFTPLKLSKDTYIGRNEELSRLIDEYESAKAEGDRRCWLLLGPPGTGKTTFIQHLAKTIGARFMLVSNRVLNNKNQFQSILLLKPSFLLLDDADRIYQNDLKEVLDQLANLNATCVITANKYTFFDSALIRPSGRIDRVLEFGLPEEEEREHVLRSYLGDFQVTPEQMTLIIERTEGMAQAHLKELSKRLRKEKFEDFIQGLDVMIRLQRDPLGIEQERKKRSVKQAKENKEVESQTPVAVPEPSHPSIDKATLLQVLEEIHQEKKAAKALKKKHKHAKRYLNGTAKLVNGVNGENDNG